MQYNLKEYDLQKYSIKFDKKNCKDTKNPF